MKERTNNILSMTEEGDTIYGRNAFLGVIKGK